MFWSDVRARTISRAKLDGSEVTVLVSSGLSVVGKDHDNKLILIMTSNMHLLWEMNMQVLKVVVSFMMQTLTNFKC